jgi:hypothetical protein
MRRKHVSKRYNYIMRNADFISTTPLEQYEHSRISMLRLETGLLPSYHFGTAIVIVEVLEPAISK